MNCKPRSISIPEDVYQEIREAAFKDFKSVSCKITEAIREYLKGCDKNG